MFLRKLCGISMFVKLFLILRLTNLEATKWLLLRHTNRKTVIKMLLSLLLTSGFYGFINRKVKGFFKNRNCICLDCCRWISQVPEKPEVAIYHWVDQYMTCMKQFESHSVLFLFQVEWTGRLCCFHWSLAGTKIYFFSS